MATKNFTQFNTATPLTTSDYVVGYNADGTFEIKTQVKDILNLVQDSDNQTLSFDENSKDLSIASGNTVSLSTFATNTDFDFYKTNVASATATLLPTTVYQSASGSFATNTLLQSTSALLTPLTLTDTLTGQLVLNTDFDSYKTDVAAATATLLPITTYQSASGNWESTYSTFSTISAFSIVAGGNTRNANITIGTNDDFHLRFETNNNARMTILSSGEVGIGTTITETASAGNGGLIVKNNLLVGGTTTIGTETANLTQPSIVNGNFQNITGLVAQGTPGWFQGIPFGWTSPNTPAAFAVWNGSGDYVANVATLASGAGGSSSFRQNLGTLQVMSDVIVTFDYPSTAIASWSTGTLNAAIYDGDFNILATSTHTTAGTYSLTAANVPVAKTIIVGFWSTPGNAGLNNVTVTIANNTVIIFSNLPTLSANLPVGAVWNNNGALRIV